MGLGTCFYFFFFIIVCLLSILVQKVEPVETEFFFLLFLKPYFPFFKRQTSILCVLGKSCYTLLQKRSQKLKKKSISYLKSLVTSISDRTIINLGICLNLLSIDYAFRHSKNSVKECESMYYIYGFSYIVFLLKVKLI